MSSIAVNMMVLNGTSTLRRCLEPLKGIVSEVVVIDTGSTDDTYGVLRVVTREIGAELKYVRLDQRFDDDFFSDEASSFRLPMPGPFTGYRIPRDWAAVRNRAVAMTAADYVLKLDADDEVVSPPANLTLSAVYLDEHPEISFVSAPYEIYKAGKLIKVEAYDRLFRRAGMTWKMPFHEYVAGKTSTNVLYAASGLRVCDRRDSTGEGVRVAYRNLKVLLHAWENGERLTISESEDVRDEALFRFTLAHEAAEVFPGFAQKLMDFVVRNVDPCDRGMVSDCYYHRGRAAAAMESFAEAMDQYQAAHDTSPHLQALLKLHQLKIALGIKAGLPELREKINELAPVDRIPMNCNLELLEQVRASM